MDAPDCKDILEQLRTVHLTLLAVCLAVLVIALSPSPTEINKANEQLGQIQRVVDIKNWDPNLLQKAAAKVAEGNGPGTGHGECQPITGRNTVYMKLIQIRTRVEIPRRWDLRYEIPGIKMNPPDLPSLSSPDTLGSFKALWDSNGTLLCPPGNPARDSAPPVDRVLLWDATYHKFALPGGRPAVQAEIIEPITTEELRHFKWVLTDNLPPGVDDQGIDRRFPGVLIQTDPLKVAKDGSKDYPFSMFTTIPPVSFPFEVRSQIINSSGLTFAHGSQPQTFETAFPELNRVAEEQSAFDFNLDHLKKILESQEGSAKESFEVFSIKFPVEATSRWALLLILSIQGYFWLHLNEYRKRAPIKGDVGWIGIYTGWAARIASAVTILVVPVSPILILCIRQIDVPQRSSPDVIFCSLASLFSFSLAVHTVYTLWLVNRGLEKSN